MAQIVNINKSDESDEFTRFLQKAVQSANLNFLLGSGCSLPAIPVLADIEIKIQEKINAGQLAEAERMTAKYLKPILAVCSQLKSGALDAKATETLQNYQSFLNELAKILFKRKSNILPKQATIFTTNNDLFIEKACDQLLGALKMNDGFSRNPHLTGKFKFSIGEFFNSVFNNGILYNYKVPVPSVNLIKLHGCMGWQRDGQELIFSLDGLDALTVQCNGFCDDTSDEEVSKFNEGFSVVLPRNEKFKHTLINQAHYDLLRIYANELDKENTLLLCAGFSFADGHLLEITRRALRNPTLKVIISCFDKKELASFQEKFQKNNNVTIVFSETGNIPFSTFSSLLTKVLPTEKDQEAVVS